MHNDSKPFISRKIRINNIEKLEDYLGLNGELEFMDLERNPQQQVCQLLESLPFDTDSGKINNFYMETGLRVQICIHKNYELTFFDKDGKYPNDNVNVFNQFFMEHYKEHLEWLFPQNEADIIIHYDYGCDENLGLPKESEEQEELQLPEILSESMWEEASKRLDLMGTDSADRLDIISGRKIDFKVIVDPEDGTIMRSEVTEDERQLIRKIQARHKFICYYIIKDEGTWMDGSTFTRYTLPYVSKYSENYEMVREDAIIECGTCPAYVVNMENIACSEITEFAFQNIGGMIINVS